MKPILGTMTFGDQVDQQTAANMLQSFFDSGNTEYDTAYTYQKGATEEMLGALRDSVGLPQYSVATKVNPHAGSLSAESVDRQFTTSLKRMGLESVDLLYLHEPDINTPITETLTAVQKHFESGRFKRLGLSNYAAWQVAEITELCRRNDWVTPSVYQGMYNAITRDVERELFLCLEYYNIAFYVYNPLAAGLLTGKHKSVSATPQDGRFAGNAQYMGRYWKSAYFDALTDFISACEANTIDPARAALRWLVHHSALSAEKGDGVIIGASSQSHFDSNLAAFSEGPLPEPVVAALDAGWEISRPHCIKYFRP